MPQYKVTYFNFAGLGEPIRYLLAYSKADFEDIRINHEQWNEIKSKTRFGKLPILEFDGHLGHQSAAIARYLGKQCGLAGANDLEQLDIDATVDDIIDMRMHLSFYFQEKDPQAKEKKLEDFKNIHQPFYLSRFEDIAKENNGYLGVKDKLTWVDIFFAGHYEMLQHVLSNPNWLDSYPTLLKLKDKVENSPGIKEYRAKRPQPSFD